MLPDKISENQQIVRGHISHVNFHNPESGFTVLKLKTDDNPMEISVVGVGLPTEEGVELVLRGNYQQHNKFGRQFKAENWDHAPPSNPASLAKFLSSGIFPGIGEKTADDIVATFGMDALKVIKQQTYRLMEVEGIGKVKARRIVKALDNHQGELEINRYLSDLDLTSGQIKKILDYYGERALDVLKNNPYQLAFDLSGFGFLRADDIGRRLNIPSDNPNRIIAGIYYSLVKSLDDGHCFLNSTQLQQKSQQILQLTTAVDFNEFLNMLEESEKIRLDQDRIYLEHVYSAEQTVARIIKEKVVQDNENSIDIEVIEETLRETEEKNRIQLSEQQKVALHEATKNNFFMITGGPGCGKTTLVRTIVATYLAAEKNVKIAAPTGKAAQRLAEICDLPASTIHRLLGYDPIKQSFVHTAGNPLAYETSNDSLEPLDLLIIDEASMIDLLLARDVFSALDNDTTLILVGDQDQLPSVGPGRVFADLLTNKDIQRVRLDKIFRQSEHSLIISSAHQVNHGLVPDIPEPDGQRTSDTYFLHRKEPERIAALAESLFCSQIPNKFGIASEHIAILTPTNQGILGTIEMNRMIQAKVNPKENQPEVIVGNNIFRPGDRVCQRVNNYQIDPAGVFNGDQGEVVDIDTKEQSMLVKLWDGRHITYKGKDLHQLSLSYVMSIHRSQGSEMPCVIMLLHDSQFILLDRQLLYTGMTRAKKLLIIVGSRRALQIATQRAKAKTRNTNLSKLIQIEESGI